MKQAHNGLRKKSCDVVMFILLAYIRSLLLKHYNYYYRELCVRVKRIKDLKFNIARTSRLRDNEWKERAYNIRTKEKYKHCPFEPFFKIK